ncbi:unnamed protein product, partial [Brenthis ino]
MSFLNNVRIFILIVFSNYNFVGSAALSLPAAHTCIIGGGYSGLAAARYLKEFGVNFTVFEAAKTYGGTWRFDPHVGVDEDGVPVYTSMYKYLRTNTPRQTMEFGGYQFPSDTPSYPSGPCFYRYIKSFVKHFNLLPNIQVRSLVMSVRFFNDQWFLTYMHTKERKNYTVSCDFVVIANGQYVKPNIPKFPGLETFKGSIIHSHDYKEPERYQNRRVLLIGAGPSGLDLALHLSNSTARLLHSHHLSYNQPDFGKNFVKKPDVKTFVSDGVIFVDDTFEEVDDVILCTGYEFLHPFLDSSSGLTLSGKYVLPLHQSIVNIRHPTMTFIGVVKKVITRVMDAQAEYIASYIAGKFKLPSQDEMLKMWLDKAYRLRVRKQKITEINTIGPDMDQYFANLTKEAGITRVPPVLSEIRDFNAQNRLDDWLHYREYDFEIIDPYNYKRSYAGSPPEKCPVEGQDE